jgi:hypothetical protein
MGVKKRDAEQEQEREQEVEADFAPADLSPEPEAPITPSAPIELPARDTVGNYVYLGPSIPGGKLQRNAVFAGGLEAVKSYFADEIAKHEVLALFVPVSEAQGAKADIARAGTLFNKYYNRIISAIRKSAE